MELKKICILVNILIKIDWTNFQPMKMFDFLFKKLAQNEEEEENSTKRKLISIYNKLTSSLQIIFKLLYFYCFAKLFIKFLFKRDFTSPKYTTQQTPYASLVSQNPYSLWRNNVLDTNTVPFQTSDTIR